VKGKAQALSARELCGEWQGIFRGLVSGSVMADDLVMRTLDISARAPKELKAESTSAAHAIIYTMANKKLGDDLSSAEKVLVQLRVACMVEAELDILLS